jgi:hypothetical protein
MLEKIFLEKIVLFLIPTILKTIISLPNLFLYFFMYFLLQQYFFLFNLYTYILFTNYKIMLFLLKYKEFKII